jgi:hypothetical protein
MLTRSRAYTMEELLDPTIDDAWYESFSPKDKVLIISTGRA